MRGEVFRLTAPRNSTGSEQRGSRPAVVLQADGLLRLSTWVIAPTSTSARPAIFRPEIQIAGQQTRVCVEQMTAVDPQRLGQRLGWLMYDEMLRVEEAMRLLLEL